MKDTQRIHINSSRYYIFQMRFPCIFGGVYWDATDRLTIGAEGRYQWDRIEQQNIFPAVSQELSKTFRSFSPRLTVDFNITPSSLLYGSFSRGYRPGGFNAGLLGLTQGQLEEIGSQGGLVGL
jgi:Outer membrane receptor proteins, mostly Fe transport